MFQVFHLTVFFIVACRVVRVVYTDHQINYLPKPIYLRHTRPHSRDPNIPTHFIDTQRRSLSHSPEWCPSEAAIVEWVWCCC